MSIETYLAFSLAAALVLVIPGPTIILVMSQAISHGKRTVLPLTIGVGLGDLTAMTLSLLGLGAVLSTSSFLFGILKWIGALYLLYLGGRMMLVKSDPTRVDVTKGNSTSNWQLFRRAYVVTSLNPKGIVFFIAFMPQFVDPAGNYIFQLGVLGTTFITLAVINAAIYGVFAGELREVLYRHKMKKIFNVLGGSALIGAGIFTAAMRKTQ